MYIKFDTSKYKYSTQIINQVTKDLKIVEFKFKVKNVKTVSLKLNGIAIKYNGYMSSDNLYEHITHISKSQLNLDTIVVKTNYFYTNTLLIRVPHKNLDSTLKEIETQIDHLNFQTTIVNDSLYRQYCIDSNFISRGVQKNSTHLKTENLMDAVLITLYDNPTYRTNYFQDPNKIKTNSYSFIDSILGYVNLGFSYMKNLISQLV
jgi:hypothetical protein